MRFGQHIKVSRHAPWAEYYCDYELLKQIIEETDAATQTDKEEGTTAGSGNKSGGGAAGGSSVTAATELGGTTGTQDTNGLVQVEPAASSSAAPDQVQEDAGSEKSFGTTGSDHGEQRAKPRASQLAERKKEQFIAIWKGELQKVSKWFMEKWYELVTWIYSRINRAESLEFVVERLSSENLDEIRKNDALLVILHSFAEDNFAALRKSVKKFDKTMGPEFATAKLLLPSLYCSFFGATCEQLCVLAKKVLFMDLNRQQNLLKPKSSRQNMSGFNLAGQQAGTSKGSTNSSSGIMTQLQVKDNNRSTSSLLHLVQQNRSFYRGPHTSTSQLRLSRKNGSSSSRLSAYSRTKVFREQRPSPLANPSDNLKSEISWLYDTVASLDNRLANAIVSHRGFHGNDDARPVENSLPAYELAWSAGLPYCECDVICTRDGKIILTHDSTLKRVALLDSPLAGPVDIVNADGTTTAGQNTKAKSKLYQDVGELDFRQIVKTPLRSGVRPPLLTEVLHSAAAISDNAKLIIELKYGNVTTNPNPRGSPPRPRSGNLNKKEINGGNNDSSTSRSTSKTTGNINNKLGKKLYYTLEPMGLAAQPVSGHNLLQQPSSSSSCCSTPDHKSSSTPSSNIISETRSSSKKSSSRSPTFSPTNLAGIGEDKEVTSPPPYGNKTSASRGDQPSEFMLEDENGTMTLGTSSKNLDPDPFGAPLSNALSKQITITSPDLDPKDGSFRLEENEITASTATGLHMPDDHSTSVTVSISGQDAEGSSVNVNLNDDDGCSSSIFAAFATRAAEQQQNNTSNLSSPGMVTVYRLIELFKQDLSLVKSVGVIMSFDLYVMGELAKLWAAEIQPLLDELNGGSPDVSMQAPENNNTNTSISRTSELSLSPKRKVVPNERSTEQFAPDSRLRDFLVETSNPDPTPGKLPLGLPLGVSESSAISTGHLSPANNMPLSPSPAVQAAAAVNLNFEKTNTTLITEEDTNNLNPNQIQRPDFLLLTNSHLELEKPQISPDLYGEILYLNAKNFSYRKHVKPLLRVTPNISLDGIYIQKTPTLSTEYATQVREIANHCILGVWLAHDDVDTYHETKKLVELGASYVNTDLPLDWNRGREDGPPGRWDWSLSERSGGSSSRAAGGAGNSMLGGGVVAGPGMFGAGMSSFTLGGKSQHHASGAYTDGEFA
ncbi:unnamed protein product [Amoebophrya sp. A120]|nr:unnamed protein product [Amoebophrya sp. A120]|eukprot:GSA120T00001187001.1